MAEDYRRAIQKDHIHLVHTKGVAGSLDIIDERALFSVESGGSPLAGQYCDIDIAAFSREDPENQRTRPGRSTAGGNLVPVPRGDGNLLLCPPAGRRLPFTIGTCRDATRWISSSPTGAIPWRSRSRRPPDGPIRTWAACALFSQARPIAAGGFLRMVAGTPSRSETASSHCRCRFSSGKSAPRGEDISLFMIDDQAVPFLAQNGFIARQFELAGNA